MPSLQQIFQIGATAVGVDLGSRAIKAVEVRRGARGVELSRYGVAATPTGALENGMVLDRSAAAAAVGALLRGAGIRRRRVIASVSGQNVLARILRLPPIPEDEVKEAVRWEAERHLPFPVEEAVLDAQVVREVTEDGQRQLEVLLAAAPEALVLTYVETLEAAGLAVEALEVSALAMVRALGRPGMTGTVAMVNLGASTSEVAIVRDGIPRFTRTVLEAAAAPGETLDGLTLQLRRTFDFYRAQYGGASVERIILCGGGARVEGVDRRLSLEMEVPAAVGTPLQITPPAHRLDAAEAGQVAPQLVTAVGLALRAVR